MRCLPLRSSCIDALVVDVPWGARNAAKAPLDASLLREALSEVNRVLVVDGVALVLLTRAAAQTIPRLVSNAGDGSHCLRVLESLDVCVGGWPVAAVTLRKVEAEPPTDGASAEAEEPTAASNAIITPCCCTIEVTSSLSNLPLSELLLVAFPHAIRSASARRAALKHRALPSPPIRQRSCGQEVKWVSARRSSSARTWRVIANRGPGSDGATCCAVGGCGMGLRHQAGRHGCAAR